MMTITSEQNLGSCFRIKLHAKSCQVEKELDDEIRVLEEFRNLLRSETDEISDIFSEATIWVDRLKQLKSLEFHNRFAIFDSCLHGYQMIT